MNNVNQENKPQDNVVQDTNLSQHKTDANVSQPEINKVQEVEVASNQENTDPNWKAFREARKKDREEKQDALKKAQEKEQEVAALKAAMEAAFSKSSPSPQAYQQYYAMNEQPEESEEQRIERKVNELLDKKQKMYEQEMAEKEYKEYPTRLNRDFPDINQVCSQENLDYLDYHYPEVSRPFQRLPEGYDKWADIYRAVKKFIPNHANAKREANRAEMNMNKPKSMSSSTTTPPGQPVRESWQEVEQRRAANWERMQKTLKGVG